MAVSMLLLLKDLYRNAYHRMACPVQASNVCLHDY